MTAMKIMIMIRILKSFKTSNNNNNSYRIQGDCKNNKIRKCKSEGTGKINIVEIELFLKVPLTKPHAKIRYGNQIKHNQLHRPQDSTDNFNNHKIIIN